MSVEALEGSLKWRGIIVALHSTQQLPVFDYQYGFVLQVVVVHWGFINDPFDDILGCAQPFEEYIHQLSTFYSVPCLSSEHLKVTGILVNVREMECEVIK